MNTKTLAGRGFTLVELLVVIVIIAALAALSMTGYVKFRKQGDRATAISTMRQLQTANMSYATDHNGRFVPLDERNEDGVVLGDWTQNTEFIALIIGDESLLTKYPGRFGGQLPPRFLDPVVVRTKARLWDMIFASYGYNEIVPGLPPGQKGGSRGFRMSQITNSARSAAFVTGTDHYFKYSGRLLWEGNPVEGKSKDGKLAFRHGGKAIVTYYDGSTSMIGPAEIRSFDSKGGANHPFWKADY